jgi:uncharacterized protein YlxP (DUF503 family)
MVIGTLRATLLIPESRCLKDKRRVVKSLLDRVAGRFNVAVAETDHLDEWTRAEIGIVTVSNDRRHANSVLDSVRNYVDGNTDAEVAEADIEIL